MQEQEKIEQLLEEIQSIELGKEYLKVLEKNIGIEKRKLTAFRNKMHAVKGEINDAKNHWLNKFSSSTRLKHEQEQDDLTFEKMEIELEIQKCEERIKTYQFQQEVIQKNVTRETHLKQSLQQYIRDRKTEIIQSGSAFGKKLMVIIDQLDEKVSIQKEIEEILAAGDKVIQILETILLNIDHKLYRRYSTQKYTKPKSIGLTTLCKSTLAEIHELAIELRKSLDDFREEIDDVIKNKDIKLAQPQKRKFYSRKLFAGEMLVKELLKTKINPAQGDELERILTDISSINGLFFEELKIIELDIKNLKIEKRKFLNE